MDVEEVGEEESEEGECDSDDYIGEDDEDNCDPEGLFDALAAARESATTQINFERSKVDGSCKLPEDFLLTSFKTAIR